MTKTFGGLHGGEAFFLFCLLVPASPLWADNPAAELETPTVEIVGTTPLPGIGTPVNQVPANVQVHTSDQITNQHALDITDYLNQNLTSVTVNSAQANPFQLDVNFRGFTASPLLGTPQGLSVFQDGVRINEAFGDTVNWDLIPQSAISSINLIPGSNPVFGLNTLGGALAIHTKSGFQYPGFTAQSLAGAFGRKSLGFEWGGHGKSTDFFVTGNAFDEDGWRDHSPSRVNQLFAKGGFQNDMSDIDVSATFADNALQGTQALPLSMLGNPAQAYTFPDRTANQLAFFNVKGSHFLTQDRLLAANVYYRKLSTTVFNSNVNDNFTGLPPAPGNMPSSNVTGDTDQRGLGTSAQITLLGDLAGRENHFTAGLSYDQGNTDFKQFQQEGGFTPDREATLTSPPVLSTSVKAINRYYGLYLTDTFAVRPGAHLTLSGRYNYAKLRLEDRIGIALNGDHSFSRFNPAAGLTFKLRADVTSYIAYNEGMRVPSPVELTCADPSAPCSLPNNFLADPPLKPVVSKTWEGGLRGRWRESTRWNVAVFRTELHDDIQFVSSGRAALNSGFFQNVGKTRREGLEMGLASEVGALSLSARYSLINATFATPLVLNSPSNSSAQPILCGSCTDIQVNPGNRIPGIPRHTLKLRAEYSAAGNWSAGINVLASSSQFARGDENNQDRNGSIPGYAVVNLDMHYRMARQWELFGTVNNVFDRKYATLGVLGRNFFTGPGNSFDFTAANSVIEQFRSPGAPRGAWIGIRYLTDARGKGE